MFNYEFKPEVIIEEITTWIRNWFRENGNDCNAIVGISGGKDSSVVAALLVRALEKERVIGVTMPCGVQEDIDDAKAIIEHLGIYSFHIDIGCTVEALKSKVNNQFGLSKQANTNLPARIRMTTLYMVSQSNNGRVANTSNLSEEYVGYSTRFGDSVGDFAPIRNLTASEVVQIGLELGLPEHLVKKTPSDGLSGLTDEENLGIQYSTLDTYIRCYYASGLENSEDANVKEEIRRIENLHNKNIFKSQPIPAYEPSRYGIRS